MGIRFREKVLKFFRFLRRYTILMIYVSLACYLLCFFSFLAYLFVPPGLYMNLYFVLMVVFLSGGVFFSGLSNLVYLFRNLK